MPRGRVLVVGCGFIGSHVVTRLAAAGEPPVVLTRSEPAAEIAALLAPGDLHLGDATDPAVLTPALEGVSRVAFCAGGLLPVDSEREPDRDRELTLGPLRNVLAALRERPGTSLTYLSSGGTIYGNPERLPASEDDPPNPTSAYGKLNLACEREIEAARAGGLATLILRCSTVYGEHQHPGRGQGAVVTFLDRIERGEPIDLYGDGTTIRDYVYAGDVAAAMITLQAHLSGPAVVNVGAGRGTSLIDVLRLTEQEIGRQAEVRRHPERGFDVHQIYLDTTRLHEMTDLEITPLPTGIARTHKWLVSRPR